MQLELMIFSDEQLTTNLHATLQDSTGLTIDLIITDNRSRMISFKPGKDNTAQLRLHRMFLTAPVEIIQALGLWLKRGRCKRSGAIVDTFIQSSRHLIDKPRHSPHKHSAPRSTTHDIQRLFDELNQTEFENSLDVPITWGKLPARRRRNSIRLGSFTEEDHLIRIHPYLDQPKVPEYFVRYIVFHEMLHAHLGVEILPSGRRDVHSKEFKRIEKAYTDYDRAVAWQENQKNLGLLLRPPKLSA